MIRRILVLLITLGAALLSFDALRAYALNGHPLTEGVIPWEAILPRAWLAMAWAIVIDLSIVAGIWGIKDDRSNWRAWTMLIIAAGASLGFQVMQLPPVAGRAVPVVALVLACLALELGPAKVKEPDQDQEQDKDTVLAQVSYLWESRKIGKAKAQAELSSVKRSSRRPALPSTPSTAHPALSTAPSTPDPALSTAPSTPDPALSTAHPAPSTTNGQHKPSSRDLVRLLLAKDIGVSAGQVMEATKVTRRRAYALLQEEKAALNGDGP